MAVFGGITQSIITFYNFYLLDPSFSNLLLSLFVSTTIRDVLSGLVELKATLGAPPLTGSLPKRRSYVFTAPLYTLVIPVPLTDQTGTGRSSASSAFRRSSRSSVCVC
jgi:hypothetical protein